MIEINELTKRYEDGVLALDMHGTQATRAMP
jgi:hypothetical protein